MNVQRLKTEMQGKRLTSSIASAAFAAIGLVAASTGASAQESKPVSLELTVRADNPGAEIHPNIYGQFAEHLGRGIYEGVWVGEDSSIPNTNGYRNDVIAALKKLKVPVVRWPGGCFADEYHWRDGIGPREERPVRVNTHWGGVTENNAFGTHEFLNFAEMIGAEVYVNGNLGSGTPREMAEWLEYMTSDSESTLANLRRENGREKPWKIHHFGIGNENWGCGGHMRPEYYSDVYRRYATFLKAPEGNRPEKVATGKYGDQYNWTEVIMSSIERDMDAMSLHYYTTVGGPWEEKGSATEYGEDEWISTLFNTLRMDEFLKKHIAIMDKHDPDGNVALYVDEWGTWHLPAKGSTPGFLYQQNTLRDAMVAALNFNIFHRYARRVKMTNIAQMINVLQAMILTDKEKMILTPTYHVFEMYTPFQGAAFLPVETEAPSYKHGEYEIPAVSATAARGKDGKVYLALANVNPERAARVSTDVAGASAQTARGRVLTAPEITSHNTFDDPDVVAPAPFSGSAKGGKLVLTVPPRSIAVVAIE